MKKSLYILTLFVSAITLSGCSGTTKEASEQTEVITPTPSVIKEEVTQMPSPAPISAFTEGVLIKKRPNNNACFTFETADGFQILSDPYEVNELLQPDVILESHQHGDHNDTSEVEGDYTLITEPGEYTFDKAEIRGFSGVHNKGDVDGTNYIFVTKMEDITIAHFASQAAVPSEEVLEQIGKVDILLIQVFVNPNYNKLLPTDLPVIVDKLQPKIIIPEHGQSDADVIIAKKLSITSEAEPSGEIIITRSMLDQMTETKVINLDTTVTR